MHSCNSKLSIALTTVRLQLLEPDMTHNLVVSYMQYLMVFVKSSQLGCCGCFCMHVRIASNLFDSLHSHSVCVTGCLSDLHHIIHMPDTCTCLQVLAVVCVVCVNFYVFSRHLCCRLTVGALNHKEYTQNNSAHIIQGHQDTHTHSRAYRIKGQTYILPQIYKGIPLNK